MRRVVQYISADCSMFTDTYKYNHIISKNNGIYTATSLYSVQLQSFFGGPPNNTLLIVMLDAYGRDGTLKRYHCKGQVGILLLFILLK